MSADLLSEILASDQADKLDNVPLCLMGASGLPTSCMTPAVIWPIDAALSARPTSPSPA